VKVGYFVSSDEGCVTDSPRIDTPRGDPRNPLTWEQLAAKFSDCAGLVLPADKVERALEAVERLQELPNVSDLTDAVS
jgi:2-methylcitrate dehydratase PrpD